MNSFRFSSGYLPVASGVRRKRIKHKTHRKHLHSFLPDTFRSLPALLGNYMVLGSNVIRSVRARELLQNIQHSSRDGCQVHEVNEDIVLNQRGVCRIPALYLIRKCEQFLFAMTSNRHATVESKRNSQHNMEKFIASIIRCMLFGISA